MVKSKADFFNLDVVEDDSYEIKLSSVDIEALKRSSVQTTRKLMNSEQVVVLKDLDGFEYLAIKLPKLYDLSTREYSLIHKGIPLKSQVDYLKFLAAYKEIEGNDVPDQVIYGILQDPKAIGSLSDSLKDLALPLIEQSQQNDKDQDLRNVTILLRSRLSLDWDEKDTEVLPQHLYQEFLLFLCNEISHWRDAPKKLISRHQTTATEKSRESEGIAS